MASDFTNLQRTMFMGMVPVSREMTGFIPAVDIDSRMEVAAKGQTVSVPNTVDATVADFTPSNVSSSGTSITPTTVDISMTNSRVARWVATGEDERRLNNSIDGGAMNYYSGQWQENYRAIANEVEADLAELYDEAASATGTSGTTPFGSSLSDAANVLKELKDRGCPTDDLQLVVDSAAGANLRSLGVLNQANTAGTDSLQRGGMLLPIFGFSVRESGQVSTHTKGTGSSDTFAAEAKGQTILSTSTIATGNYLEGDIIQAGTGGRKYVVSSADVSTPALTINGEFGTLAAITSGTNVLLQSNYTANLAFHRKALKLVARAPDIPDAPNIQKFQVRDPVSGLTFLNLRIAQYGQVTYETHLLWGVQATKSDWMSILQG